MIGDSMKRKLCLILLIILSTFMFIGCSNNESKKLVENKDYFIVDFDNKDYFYLEDLKLKLLIP